jgi:DEAD/DEAH box helicase domain-containing protein
VVFYERVPGGLGFSRRLYQLHRMLIARAEEWVTACPCSEGCPSCVGPPGEDGAGGKQETAAMLSLLFQAPAPRALSANETGEAITNTGG